MNCSSFEERIAQYVDGSLERGEVRLVEAHLESCPGCAEFREALEQDRMLLRMAPGEVADADFAAMRREIRRAVAGERRGFRLVPALLMAAAILLAVGIATRQVKPPAPPRQIAIRQAEPHAPPPPSPPKVVAAGRRKRLPPLRPDPALEAALREFIAAEQARAVPAVPVTPAGIRIATGDPNVVLILLQETSGASYE